MSRPERDAFGALLRAHREGRGWSLAGLAAHSGVSKGALSKIENGDMSPTYETLRKLADGLGLSVAGLVSERADAAAPEKPPAASRPPAAAVVPADPTRFTHALLAAPGAALGFTPVLTTVLARSLEEYGDWDSHDTADFLYCLSGRVAVLFRDHPTLELGAGDAMTMDGREPHAVVRRDGDEARILWVSGPVRQA